MDDLAYSPGVWIDWSDNLPEDFLDFFEWLDDLPNWPDDWPDDWNVLTGSPDDCFELNGDCNDLPDWTGCNSASTVLEK